MNIRMTIKLTLTQDAMSDEQLDDLGWQIENTLQDEVPLVDTAMVEDYDEVN